MPRIHTTRGLATPPGQYPAGHRSRRNLARALRLALLLIAAPAIAATTLATAPSVARADDLDDFELAREAYASQEYEAAARRFEALVGGPIPRVRNAALRLESRKYLGACYLFLGREQEAVQQFERLLEEDPTYTLDPVGFPAEVIAVFEAARERQAAARAEAERREAEERERRQREEVMRLAAEQERLRRLEELANTETVVVRNNRFLASLPFGTGQFRNGQRRFGAALAVTESLLAGAAIGTFIAHARLQRTARLCARDSVTCPFPRLGPDANGARQLDPEELRFLDQERRLRIGNWVMFSALGAVAAFGIIEAHVNYVPERRTTRPRPQVDDSTPAGAAGSGDDPEADAESADDQGPEADDTPPAEPSAQLDLLLSPTGAGLRLRF